MTEVYKMSLTTFMKNMSIFTIMLLLWIFSLTQKWEDLALFYGGIFLTVLSLFLLYFTITQKQKKILEISPKGVVINESNKLSWESIKSFNLRMIRIKSKEVPMIDVYMNEDWDSSSLSKWASISAHINQQTWFWEFLIPVSQLSVDENDLYDRLNTLLKLDEDNREQYLSHNKYR